MAELPDVELVEASALGRPRRDPRGDSVEVPQKPRGQCAFAGSALLRRARTGMQDACPEDTFANARAYSCKGRDDSLEPSKPRDGEHRHNLEATMNVLISGAGIAGPCLAYWLQRYGLTPTLVERAPQLRRGGYLIDFWGAGFDVADRMGLARRFRWTAGQRAASRWWEMRRSVFPLLQAKGLPSWAANKRQRATSLPSSPRSPVAGFSWATKS